MPSGLGRVWEKAGEKKGGSRYQASVAKAKWDSFIYLYVFFFLLWSELPGRCDVGMWELRSPRPAFAYRFPSFRLSFPAVLVMVNYPPPFIPLFMALMVLNDLYMSECTAPSVHVGRAREQLGQRGGITWFHPSLKAVGQRPLYIHLKPSEWDL